MAAEGAERFLHTLEVVSSIATERANDVFKYGVSRLFSIRCLPHLADHADRLIEQTALSATKTSPPAGHTLVLARRAKGNYVNRINLAAVYLPDVAKVLKRRKSFRCYGNGVFLYLRRPNRMHSGKLTGKKKSAASIKQAAYS